eukprot:921137_1
MDEVRTLNDKTDGLYGEEFEDTRLQLLSEIMKNKRNIIGIKRDIDKFKEPVSTHMHSLQQNGTTSNPQRRDTTAHTTDTENTRNTPTYNLHTDHKDQQHSSSDDTTSLSRTKSPNKIKQIDEALATYYAGVGVHDYFNSNGIGRFCAFIEREAFDVDPSSIEQELGPQSNADNTMYTEFDVHCIERNTLLGKLQGVVN